MTEEKKQESSSLTRALPVTVVLAMLAGLIITHSLPYQDERPSARPLLVRYPAAQDVDARLWQDPFAAVDGVSEETPAEKLSIVANNDDKTQRIDATRQIANPSPHTPSQIYKDNEGKKLTSEDKITILAVTLQGGPYQEAAEERMRRRYAVLSALANQDAVPQDAQHIGYFQPACEPEPAMILQHRVPFEWWSFPADNRKVLLLWLNESSLREKPAAKIQELLRQASQDEAVFNYAVIGPNTSSLLLDMLKEVKGINKSDPITPCTDKHSASGAKSGLGTLKGQDIAYFSAGATASDERLLQNILPAECKNISACMKAGGIALYRTSATDAAMMDVLVDELEARRVKKTDHIVILSEWDTFYGQVMPEEFKKAWSNHPWNNHYNIPDENKVSIQDYGYMRGLDGKLPAQGDKAGNAAEKPADSKNKSGANALIEFPEGQSQKDYLRRLTGKILELDQYLKDAGDWNVRSKGIAAFGILGSDVHDKLLILEALRPYFPHKLFFTTDLDANFIHPARWHQTHNLLVASAYDLELRQELQDRIPPFRDSYQTAFFLAAQMAIRMEIEGGKSIVGHIDIPQPRLFEIGRSHPVSLPTYSDAVSPRSRNNVDKLKCSWTNWTVKACIHQLFGTPLPRLFEIEPSYPTLKDSECSWTNLSKCPTVQPLIFATSYINWTWGGMTAIVLAAIGLVFVSWRVRERIGQFAIGVAGGLLLAIYLTWLFAVSVLQWYLIWAGVGLVAILIYLIRQWILIRVAPFYSGIVVGVFLLLAYCQTQIWNYKIIQYDAEPFYWLEGVSAWPSQLLRLLAVLFATGFFFWGRMRIRKMQTELQEQREAENSLPLALPSNAAQLGRCDVLFIGSWKSKKKSEESEANNEKIVKPDVLWEKYLGYCCQKKLFIPGSCLRVIIHGLVFYLAALLIIELSSQPNVPVRGDYAGNVNFFIIRALVVPSTILLIMWVVENARLCERLIFALSAKPSQWNENAKNWAIHEKNLARECVDDWLDIQLVARLTATFQPLIFGPVVCIALLVLARSPAIDDWDMPLGLEIVFIAMLLYAISAEVFLQRGATRARAKAIAQLSGKIRALRNMKRPDEAAIKRIESEIECIMALREGAFRPWYEWPLLQSFGGLGTLVAAQQYIEVVWRNGSL